MADTTIPQDYIQYLMIVSVILQNFSGIIDDTKTTITNLVGMMNTLVPILITLMLTTGNIVSANVVQPVLFFVIGIIGNFISSFIIPIVLIGMSLSIVSNLSENIKLDKLSKYMKSGVVWILGITLTIFVGLLSRTKALFCVYVARICKIGGVCLGGAFETCLRWQDAASRRRGEKNGSGNELTRV